jgi:hypothetical protein
MDDLTKEDYEVIFDVLNVYDPNDISHVFPEMGEEKFLKDVTNAWKKILNIISEEAYNEHFDDWQIQPIRDEGSRSTHTWGERSWCADNDPVEGKLKELLSKKALQPVYDDDGEIITNGDKKTQRDA